MCWGCHRMLLPRCIGATLRPRSLHALDLNRILRPSSASRVVDGSDWGDPSFALSQVSRPRRLRHDATDGQFSGSFPAVLSIAAVTCRPLPTPRIPAEFRRHFRCGALLRQFGLPVWARATHLASSDDPTTATLQSGMGSSGQELKWCVSCKPCRTEKRTLINSTDSLLRILLPSPALGLGLVSAPFVSADVFAESCENAKRSSDRES